MESTDNLALPYIMPSQAQKHVTHNEALRMLDAIIHLAVHSRDIVEPPSGATAGARYIVSSSPSAEWSGHANEIAAYQDGGWAFYTPTTGWIAWVQDENRLYIFSGTDWHVSAPDSINPATLIGINSTADETNRLAVASPATLLSHEGDDHQLKINKAEAGDTASVLFQSGFVGHAEFGLAGDNDWHVKTSPDGEVWNHPFRIAANDGKINVNQSLWNLSAVNIIGTGASGFCFTVSNTNANNVSKGGAVFTCAQYSNANTPFMVMGPWSTSLDNTIYYGGGGWDVPDATGHWFFAGAHSPGTNNTATRAFTVNHAGVWSHRNNAPFSNNTHSLGTSSLRWSVVHAATGTINTSDGRLKTDVVPVPLGLDFLLDLEPVSYRWIIGGHDIETRREQAIPDGPPATDEVSVQAILPKAGRRTHYGLIAQQVKDALDAHGVNDFAGWTLADKSDPTSEQGLRYDQFVPILVRAVQELAHEVRQLSEKQTA